MDSPRGGYFPWRLRLRGQSLEVALLEGATLEGRLRLRPGVVHARRRRIRGDDQVRRQDAARGEDGRPRRRPPGHPRVRLVQGARGGEGARARGGGLRHVARLAGLVVDPVPDANNSVRVSDSFMQAAEAGTDWNLTARVDGSVIETINARDLLRQIADAAWRCADPGMQYDTTINSWHTLPNTGRINASNPCFPGDARVHSTHGLMTMFDLWYRACEGEEIRVYTHRATAETPGEGVLTSLPLQVVQTGYSPILRLRFANGHELRCTPNHRIWTLNRGWVAAEDLTEEDRVLLNDTPARPLSMLRGRCPRRSRRSQSREPAAELASRNGSPSAGARALANCSATSSVTAV